MTSDGMHKQEPGPGALTRTPLFAGLPPSDLDAIARHLSTRSFRAREIICQEGEPGTSLFVIADGLALVAVSDRSAPSGVQTVARLRRGDVVGEMSLITGEPRSATVVAAVPTTVLELSRDDFAAVLARYPAIVSNLNRILSQRLAQTTLRQSERRRGEAVGIIVGRQLGTLVSPIVEATTAGSPHSVAALDVRSYFYAPRFALGGEERHLEQTSLEMAIANLDDMLADHGTVLIAADIDGDNVSLLLDHMDRLIALASESDFPRLQSLTDDSAGRRHSVEVVLVGDYPGVPHHLADLPVIRTIADGASGRSVGRSMDRDIAWVGRHLSRTKLGLALGAGGAKGYAHVGALKVLERAGYTVDYVAGSSIGAMVSACIALGLEADEVDKALRRVFSPDNVAAMFKLSMAGTSTGLDTMRRACQEMTDERLFADTIIPLTIMSVDLTSRQPAPLSDGPIWEALLAATALAGMFPPYQRNDHRLVDGVALVPVPTGSVIEAGADVTVSVNLMSREVLPAWPGGVQVEPPASRPGSRMLETLLEVMDLAQLDASVRHAALADVVLTPRFGPASWRDFHLADLFLAAGETVAEEQLATLTTFARPQLASFQSKGALDGTTVHLH